MEKTKGKNNTVVEYAYIIPVAPACEVYKVLYSEKDLRQFVKASDSFPTKKEKY